MRSRIMPRSNSTNTAASGRCPGLMPSPARPTRSARRFPSARNPVGSIHRAFRHDGVKERSGKLSKIEWLLKKRPALESGVYNGPVVACYKYKGRPERNEGIGDGIAALSLKIEVEDRTIEKIEPDFIKCLADRANRANGDTAEISKHRLDGRHNDRLIFSNKDAQPLKLVEGYELHLVGEFRRMLAIDSRLRSFALRMERTCQV